MPFALPLPLAIPDLNLFIENQWSNGASLIAQLVKNPPSMQETPVLSLDWEDPLEKERRPTPVFWPGESHGLYSPWGRKELDMSHFPFHSFSDLISMMFLWGLWATKKINLIQGGGSMKPLIYSQSIRSKGDTLNLMSEMGWGQSYRTQPLTWGIWCYLSVKSSRSELNCRTPSWYQKIAWLCRGILSLYFLPPKAPQNGNHSQLVIRSVFSARC